MSGAGQGKKQYPPILPAPSSSSSSPGQTRTPELPPKRQKRAGTGRFACDACRARKSACDSRRPTCSTCAKRQSQCVYTPRLASSISLEDQVELDQLRKQNDDFRNQQGGTVAADVLQRVRTLPEDQALLLFHQLRASGPGNVPNNNVISTDDIRPASALNVEYELMVRHPLLYPVVSPQHKIILPIANLAQLSGQEQHDPQEDLSGFLSPHRTVVEPPESPAPSSEPLPSSPIDSDLCDQRLSLFDVHNWLQVPVPSGLAARAISFYLLTEHPMLGLFDVDLFLNDLVARRTDFCSPLLLSAVLSVACQGYTAIDPEAASFSYEFFVEAERLYSEEKIGGPQYESATMTIAAARLLFGAALRQGRMRVASDYLFDGVQMAHANGLLAVARDAGARHWLDDDINNVRATSHAAWGTFCTAILYGTSYWSALVEIQPWLPIPGTVIHREDGSVVPFNLPSYMGQSFTQFCKLAPLIRNILHQYRLGPHDRASFDLAEETYMRLLEWADSLPITMGQASDMPQHVAIVHIQFHTAILDLFRPFLHQNPRQLLELRSFSARYRTVEDVCLASINQLKHLVLVFRTQYRHASSSYLWHNALLYVANDCLSTQTAPLKEKNVKGVEMSGAASDDAKRINWFLACVDGYKALAPQFPILGGVIRGLLSMGIEKGLITAAEGRAYMDGVIMDPAQPSQTYTDVSEKQWISGRSSSIGSEPPELQDNFIVDLNRAMSDPNAASLEALCQRFNEVVMLDKLSADQKPLNTT